MQASLSREFIRLTSCVYLYLSIISYTSSQSASFLKRCQAAQVTFLLSRVRSIWGLSKCWSSSVERHSASIRERALWACGSVQQLKRYSCSLSNMWCHICRWAVWKSKHDEALLFQVFCVSTPAWLCLKHCGTKSSCLDIIIYLFFKFIISENLKRLFYLFVFLSNVFDKVSDGRCLQKECK